ncbi:MAG: DUF3999 family protein [Methyloglobulus sp.]|nr:DUF3999 family protein [Methyloglobulus sp.]
MFANKISRVTVLISLLFPQLAAAETEISPANFSHTAPITFNDPKAVAVTVHLPQWCYFASKYQLTDLRIFNAEGIAVAHQLMPIQQNTPSSEFSVDAIAIPVEADVKEVVGREADIQLDIKGKIAIHMSDIPKGSKLTAKSKIAQWILDDPKLSLTTINNFRFELDETHKADFEAEITIESSEDLRTWQPVVSNQKLLAYFGGHRLAQLSITIPASKSSYWRIRSESSDLSRIVKIYAKTPSETTSVTEKITVDCQLSATKERVLCPLKGAQLPINSVQFNFGSQRVAFNALINTYKQVPQLDKLTSKQQPSQMLNGMLTSSESTVFKLNGLAIEALELMVQQGGQLGISSAPSVTVEWSAQQLTFLAHGSVPFTLAIGADQLVKRSEQVINSEWSTAVGIITEPVQQEPEALSKLIPKRPWLLWGLLAGSVLMLGWMAIRLLKER